MSYISTKGFIDDIKDTYCSECDEPDCPVCWVMKCIDAVEEYAVYEGIIECPECGENLEG